MKLQIILSIFSALALIVCIVLTWYNHTILKLCEDLKSECYNYWLSCGATKTLVEHEALTQRLFLIGLKERYLHSLYLSIKKYKQSQKEKNRKLSFKSRNR